ncbi:MAG: phosphonate metabolism transcriptional regulator PhnF [Desulfuromonadales bacterium]|nr:phosphonate metabolism transcriptional regulator PhnF [Desulfuromonadales bacterium]
MSVYQIEKGAGYQPVYRQISEKLSEEVQSFYHPGDLLPPENELASLFGVNRHTLRKAVDELVADGLVQRQHGRGVYVLDSAIKYSIGSRTRFTETLEGQGYSTASQVLDKQVISARGKVAKRLGIAEGERVIYIESLRKVEGTPFCLISHYLPLSLGPELFEKYNSGSLHKFLEKSCAINLTRQESLVSTTLPDADEGKKLQMPLRIPILKVKSINIDTKTQNPVEYAVTRFRGDAAELSFNP